MTKEKIAYKKQLEEEIESCNKEIVNAKRIPLWENVAILLDISGKEEIFVGIDLKNKISKLMIDYYSKKLKTAQEEFEKL